MRPKWLPTVFITVFITMFSSWGALVGEGIQSKNFRYNSRGLGDSLGLRRVRIASGGRRPHGR